MKTNLNRRRPSIPKGIDPKLVLQVLRSGRTLVSDPAHWTRGALSRDRQGRPTLSHDRAVCWCSTGALNRGSIEIGNDRSLGLRKAAESFLRAAIWDLNPGLITTIPFFNDSSSHAQVLVVWDKAIELATNVVRRHQIQTEGKS